MIHGGISVVNYSINHVSHSIFADFFGSSIESSIHCRFLQTLLVGAKFKFKLDKDTQF